MYIHMRVLQIHIHMYMYIHMRVLQIHIHMYIECRAYMHDMCYRYSMYICICIFTTRDTYIYIEYVYTPLNCVYLRVSVCIHLCVCAYVCIQNPVYTEMHT